MSTWLTSEDVQNYGSDLVDFSQRAAIHAVAPHLQQLAEDNAQLKERLAREARIRLDQQVEQALPNFREIDRDPRWHRWLLGTDAFTGRPRQELLNSAIASGSAARCIAFFRSFLSEAGSTQAQSPSTSYEQRARSAPAGRVYTRAEIAKLFDSHRRGAWLGREAEWARQEVDIIRASKEGRITGGVDVNGK